MLYNSVFSIGQGISYFPCGNISLDYRHFQTITDLIGRFPPEKVTLIAESSFKDSKFGPQGTLIPVTSHSARVTLDQKHFTCGHSRIVRK